MLPTKHYRGLGGCLDLDQNQPDQKVGKPVKFGARLDHYQTIGTPSAPARRQCKLSQLTGELRAAKSSAKILASHPALSVLLGPR